MKGYLDRIEDDKFAVILVEQINQEFIIAKSELPAGSTEKTYFDLTIEKEKITSIKRNEQTTVNKQKNVDDLMSKIRSKSNGSKFKKK
ncbi:DUF3006 family protein [Aquibacillus saliphilus]|uniref:DUF3006 family protein n=1 Tax=Aquibacillus saliphilus TaxID=1909422 RepID=UPI001CEFE37E|nr:DUF3006 family protein [Aquibacillus saliphilus]